MGRVAFYGIPDPKCYNGQYNNKQKTPLSENPRFIFVLLSYMQYRLLTNLFMEKQYVKLHNNGQATVFAISNRGAGGEAPCKKNDVILRACPQAYTPEGSRDAPIYKRVAVP